MQHVPISMLWLYISKYKDAYIQHLVKHYFFSKNSLLRFEWVQNIRLEKKAFNIPLIF